MGLGRSWNVFPTRSEGNKRVLGDSMGRIPKENTFINTNRSKLYLWEL